VQTFLGVADSSTALQKIYHDALVPRDTQVAFTADDLRDLRPYLIVGTGDDFALRIVGEGTRGLYGASGELYARLEKTVSDYPVSEIMSMRNVCGTVMMALAGYSPTQPHAIDIRQISCDRPVLTDEAQIAEIGDAIQCEIRVMWGRNQ
jgi:hypothetical protein